MVGARIRNGLLAATLALAALTLGAATSASAATPWQACNTVADQFECATFTVPLDRTGILPGDTRVRAIRAPAAEGPRLGTMFVIAGGPGQSADVMIDLIDQLFAGANRYDIIALDQRGSGVSEPLSCPRLQSGNFAWNGADPKTDGPITDCSISLGAARGAYNTYEAVEDLEAVRAELGVANATFFGISYGTKVALAYAKAYPAHTKALLLDSVLPTDMPGAFDLDAIEGLRQALTRLCSAKRCQTIEPNPANGIFRLAKRLTRRPIDAFVVSPDGMPSQAQIDAIALYDTVFSADMNPFIYSQLPSALESALAGRTAALVRLYAIASGAAGSASTERGANLLAARVRAQRKAATPPGRETDAASDFNTTMYFATTCADFDPPWSRSSDLTGRQGAIDDLANRTPSTAFYPFPRAVVAADSTAAYCRGWQQDPVQPAIAQGPLPNIPTLALTGTLDLRTPTRWAVTSVEGDPSAQVVQIPNVGHSAIGSDLSGCALSLAKRFLIFGATDGKCKETAPAIPIAPLPTRSVNAVRPARGSCRKISRARCRRTLKVLTAGYLGLRDVVDQLAIGSSQLGSGLYGGSWSLDFDDEDIFATEPSQLTLMGISAVPGVDVSGALTAVALPRLDGQLRIGGYRVSVSGHVAYDRTGDSLTLRAKRGRTSAKILIRPRSRTAGKLAPSRQQLALRQRMALAVGPGAGHVGR